MNELSSSEAEVNVIASILVDKYNQKYIDDIDLDDFYIKANRKIFELIKELHGKDETIDMLTVKELGVSKKYDGTKLLMTLTKMTDDLVFSSNIQKYIDILKNLSIKRKIFSVAKKVCEELVEIDVNKDESDVKNEVVQKFLNIKTNQKKTNFEMTEVMCETLQDIESKYQKRDDFAYKTGYLNLDKIIEGLHEQELTIIAARPRGW